MYSSAFKHYFFKDDYTGTLVPGEGVYYYRETNATQAYCIDLYVAICNGRIQRFRFKANAPPVVIAGLNFMGGNLEGQSQDALIQIKASDIMHALFLTHKQVSEVYLLLSALKGLSCAIKEKI
jgi:hypothetical protein